MPDCANAMPDKTTKLVNISTSLPLLPYLCSAAGHEGKISQFYGYATTPIQ